MDRLHDTTPRRAAPHRTAPHRTTPTHPQPKLPHATPSPRPSQRCPRPSAHASHNCPHPPPCPCTGRDRETTPSARRDRGDHAELAPRSVAHRDRLGCSREECRMPSPHRAGSCRAPAHHASHALRTSRAPPPHLPRTSRAPPTLLPQLGTARTVGMMNNQAALPTVHDGLP